MKQRFNFLDIRAIINEIKPKLINKFIQNFNTTQQRIIYIKFSSKDILLIEPGIRIHLTSEADDGISHFCNILRKKARRDKVIDIYQVGFDRVIVFELSRQKIVIEFFSGGNVFILDEFDKVVEVFRVVKELDIIKNTQYVFNPAEFDFSWENFCNMEFKEFLPFEKELVDNLIKKINKLTGTDILVDKDPKYKTIFNDCLQEFNEFISNIGGFGAVQMKKGKPFSFFPFDIEIDNKKTFQSFNEAVEFFFMDRRKKKIEKVDKLQKIRNKQYEHIKELENMVKDMTMKADLILKNADIVENVLDIHNYVIKNKLNWNDFLKFKEDEKSKGNEIADRIVKLDFKNKSCIIDLKDNEDSHFIEISFDKSLHSNAQNYFEKRKKFEEKILKTEKAIDTIKIKTYTKEEKIKIQRSVFWFEKFNFCFTTDKKLVIGGKNAQQNEIIVKKHLTPNHLYFHTESSGGSSVISEADVNIDEVALVALCNSACWEVNVVSPVFYVKSDQVSKTPPTGQFLPKGSFLIRGTKTYVNVYKLEYGVGLLFKTSDDIQEGDYFIKYEDAVFVTNPSNYEIDYALPLSAPYKVLKDLYKFRVRILPGKDKKGKVIQGIISHFIKDTEERIIKIIKRISVEEFMNVLPTNIKIGKDIK